MFWLQSCPRCGGNLYDGRDHYGQYIACIQCGHYLFEAEEAILKHCCSAQTHLSHQESPC